MNEITTTDLAKFGTRELVELEMLLKAWRENGLPDDFNGEDVHAMMNMNSGNVFLTNEDCQVAMLTSESKLESFYNCPYCGHEGFKDDMEHDPQDKDCTEYMEELGVKVA